MLIYQIKWILEGWIYCIAKKTFQNITNLVSDWLNLPSKSSKFTQWNSVLVNSTWCIDWILTQSKLFLKASNQIWKPSENILVFPNIAGELITLPGLFHDWELVSVLNNLPIDFNMTFLFMKMIKVILISRKLNFVDKVQSRISGQKLI